MFVHSKDLASLFSLCKMSGPVHIQKFLKMKKQSVCCKQNPKCLDFYIVLKKLKVNFYVEIVVATIVVIINDNYYWDIKSSTSSFKVMVMYMLKLYLKHHIKCKET